MGLNTAFWRLRFQKVCALLATVPFQLNRLAVAQPNPVARKTCWVLGLVLALGPWWDAATYAQTHETVKQPASGAPGTSGLPSGRQSGSSVYAGTMSGEAQDVVG